MLARIALFMSKDKEILDSLKDKEYEHGFVTDVEQEFIPKGLNEDIIRLISAKKEEPEWMLEFRLEAFRRWQKMTLPTWAHLDIPEIDFQDIIYYAAPKKDEDRPKEIDPDLRRPSINSAFLFTKGPHWQAWLWMRCSIRFP